MKELRYATDTIYRNYWWYNNYNTNISQ